MLYFPPLEWRPLETRRNAVPVMDAASGAAGQRFPDRRAEGRSTVEQLLRDPAIVVRGDVADAMVAYGKDKLLQVASHTGAPVLELELRLDHHGDPARARGNHVEMSLDLDGTAVRARYSAPTMREAIDGAAARLRRRMEAVSERPQSRQLRHRDRSSWHHDDRPTERPHFFPRPVDDRTVVRRKSFVLRPESIEEAVFDLELLDHDFLLFRHDASRAEAVVYRTDDGYGLAQRVLTPEDLDAIGIGPFTRGPVPVERSLEDAVAVLDATDEPFDFFVDRVTDRGCVVYRRYDGNYGLVEST